MPLSEWSWGPEALILEHLDPMASQTITTPSPCHAGVWSHSNPISRTLSKSFSRSRSLQAAAHEEAVKLLLDLVSVLLRRQQLLGARCAQPLVNTGLHCHADGRPRLQTQRVGHHVGEFGHGRSLRVLKSLINSWECCAFSHRARASATHSLKPKRKVCKKMNFLNPKP